MLCQTKTTPILCPFSISENTTVSASEVTTVPMLKSTQLSSEPWAETTPGEPFLTTGDSKYANVLTTQFKVVQWGYPRYPDSHDMSECHHLYDLSTPDCQISSPSYQFNSLNFDSVITP